MSSLPRLSISKPVLGSTQGSLAPLPGRASKPSPRASLHKPPARERTLPPPLVLRDLTAESMPPRAMAGHEVLPEDDAPPTFGLTKTKEELGQLAKKYGKELDAAADDGVKAWQNKGGDFYGDALKAAVARHGPVGGDTPTAKALQEKERRDLIRNRWRRIQARRNPAQRPKMSRRLQCLV
jgi:hypothetical protein